MHWQWWQRAWAGWLGQRESGSLGEQLGRSAAAWAGSDLPEVCAPGQRVPCKQQREAATSNKTDEARESESESERDVEMVEDNLTEHNSG